VPATNIHAAEESLNEDYRRSHSAVKAVGTSVRHRLRGVDDDTVSPTNIGRQGFCPNDVGDYKASFIVNRVNRLNALMGLTGERRPGALLPARASTTSTS